MRRNKSGVYQADGVIVREEGLRVLRALSPGGMAWPLMELDWRPRTLTLRALYERDFIVSDRHGRHQITARGLAFLQALDETARRYDGLCPRCKEAPREVLSSGRVMGYCRTCRRKKDAELREYARRRVLRQVVGKAAGR